LSFERIDTKNNYMQKIMREKEFESLRDQWTEFGKTDPMYWVISRPSKKGNKWTPEEFFEHGRVEVDTMLTRLKTDNDINLGTCLDFGCGPGRLTQSLANYFRQCHGVDISPSMVKLGNKLNKHGNRCQYHVNQKNDLTLFPDNTFDFIYTTIVLQHMRTKFQKNYIQEFLRVLKPNGLLVFDLPSSFKVKGEKDWERPGKSIDLNLDFEINVDKNQIKSRETFQIQIKLRSEETAKTFEPYQLVANWLDDEYNLIDYEHATAPIQNDADGIIKLIIKAPRYKGNYLLGLYIGHPNSNWVDIDQTKIKTIAFEVLPEEEGIEMNQTPYPQVLEWILSSSGMVAKAVKIDISREFYSYRYEVLKK